MINTLKLRGFQSHETTEVSFHPNLTCIIGATDSGKSSLLRGPRLVFENKPAGNEFIRNGYDTTDVDIEFDDTVVSRTKGKVNSYTVDGEVLKAFGQSVPDTANNKMRIDAGLCIQRQSSPYFLLGNTPSERARLVDGFCDISIASLSAANARKQALRADRQADTLRETLAPQKARQTALNAFCENKGAVGRVEAGLAKLGRAEAQVQKLSELITRRNKTNGFALVDGLDNKIAESVTVISALVLEYNKITETITKLVGFSKKLSFAIPEFSIDVSDIVADIGTLTATDTAIGKLTSAITTLSKPIPSFDVDLQPATQMMSSLSDNVAHVTRITAWMSKLRDIGLNMDGQSQKLVTVEAELALIPNCPLCGSKLCE